MEGLFQGRRGKMMEMEEDGARLNVELQGVTSSMRWGGSIAGRPVVHDR